MAMNTHAQRSFSKSSFLRDFLGGLSCLMNSSICKLGFFSNAAKIISVRLLVSLVCLRMINHTIRTGRTTQIPNEIIILV